MTLYAPFSTDFMHSDPAFAAIVSIAIEIFFKQNFSPLRIHYAREFPWYLGHVCGELCSSRCDWRSGIESGSNGTVFLQINASSLRS